MIGTLYRVLLLAAVICAIGCGSSDTAASQQTPAPAGTPPPGISPSPSSPTAGATTPPATNG